MPGSRTGLSCASVFCGDSRLQSVPGHAPDIVQPQAARPAADADSGIRASGERAPASALRSDHRFSGTCPKRDFRDGGQRGTGGGVRTSARTGGKTRIPSRVRCPGGTRGGTQCESGQRALRPLRSGSRTVSAGKSAECGKTPGAGCAVSEAACRSAAGKPLENQNLSARVVRRGDPAHSRRSAGVCIRRRRCGRRRAGRGGDPAGGGQRSSAARPDRENLARGHDGTAAFFAAGSEQ